MALAAEKVTFEQANWDATAEEHFGLIDGVDPEWIAFCRGEVELRHKALMAVKIGDERVGTLLWGVAHEPTKTVFIIEEMGAYCRDGYDLASAVVSMADAFAPKFRATHIRCETRRPGLARKMRQKGRVWYIIERPVGE